MRKSHWCTVIVSVLIIFVMEVKAEQSLVVETVATASSAELASTAFVKPTPATLAPASIPAILSKQSASKDCMGCHEQATHAWQMSDHAKAMAMPTSTNILADFDGTSALLYSQKAEFSIENGIYKAKIIDLKNNSSELFTIKYTFGHYPLQQYLVETHANDKKGSLHVLPFAWDSRPVDEGGQRWYHNYSNEPINANDRLHWRQPLQNWNGMCADCHSDELTRNYNPVSNTFNTQFSGINVGCVSCHGQMPDAHKEAGYASTQANEQTRNASKMFTETGSWTMLEDRNTAIWKLNDHTGNLISRDNSFMDTCFACHALRAPLTDGFKANTALLDNFSPQLVAPPNYHADGQIKEEVYVYGSFLQSKMYAAGVNCLDCHNAHTMKLKVEGNGLCLQCHKATVFNVEAHFKHKPNTAGAQCVNCHMPDNVYMGVDNRRDHSFKIPRPDLSDQFATPNACVACHTEQENSWAAAQVKEWFGEPKTLSPTRSNLLRLRHGQQITLDQHLAIIADTNIDVISRASAIEMLPRSAQSVDGSQLQNLLSHTNPLIRLAAARVAELLPPSQRVSLVSPLLKDDLRALRTAAALALVSLSVAKEDITAYTNAFKELLVVNQNSAWRGEGRLNQGNIALQTGDMQNAEMAYKASTQIDPYFDVAYTNLADLYRAKQREDLVSAVLTEGMQNVPNSPDIAYSYGLHMVRMGKVDQAVNYFKKAMQLNTENPQLAYTYALAIDGTGNTSLAISELKSLVPKYQISSQLIELGLYLAQKQNDKQAFEWFKTYQ